MMQLLCPLSVPQCLPPAERFIGSLWRYCVHLYPQVGHSWYAMLHIDMMFSISTCFSAHQNSIAFDDRPQLTSLTSR